MCAFPLSVDNCYCPRPMLQASIVTTTNPSRFPSNTLFKFKNFTSPKHSMSLLRPTQCSSDDYYGDYGSRFDAEDDNDDSDYVSITGEELNCVAEQDGIVIEINKLGRNSRRIKSKIWINARLEDVWSILTDYENLADFIPGLAFCKLVEKKGNFARLFQIGQQNLPFGLKFNAKATLDCYEKDVEILAFGKKRDIEFKMTEGDFQVFEGKWSIEQFNKPTSGDGAFVLGQDFKTTLSYFVDVKPKLWLPVHLIEGRIYREIKTNLSCIREEAQKMIQNTLQGQ